MEEIEKAKKKHLWGPDNPPPRSPGRGKGNVSLTTRLKRKILKKHPESRKIQIEMLADVILTGALSGNYRFVEMIYQRLEGKVADKHEVGGLGGGPIVTQSAEELSLLKEIARERIKRLLEEGKQGQIEAGGKEGKSG